MSLKVRGVRGAITVDHNDRDTILAATEELLTAVIIANTISLDDVASIIFSTTSDLNAEFPALAARRLGWLDTPLLCTHEMDVPHGLPHVIRILVHWNTTKTLSDIQHVYLRGAVVLRPDKVPAAVPALQVVGSDMLSSPNLAILVQ